MKYDKNILIVDDVSSITDGMCRIFKRIFANCYTAANGVEALQRCQEQHIDLLITDLVMPEMDGLTLIKHIKDEYSHIEPIIVISGEASQQVLDEVSALNIKAFSKPIDIDALEHFFTQTFTS